MVYLKVTERVDGEARASDKQKHFIRAVSKEVSGNAFPEDALQDLGETQAAAIVEQLKTVQRERHAAKLGRDAKLTGLETGKLEGIHFGILLAAVVFLIVIWLFTTF